MALEDLLGCAALESGPFGDHLRHYLRLLQQELELITAMRRVVTSSEPVRLESAIAFKLYSLGLVHFRGNDVAIRCDLYRRYFRDRLTDS